MQNKNPWIGMPTTRFQGSKKKLLPNLHPVFSELQFNSCLDAFGGTGAVSFLLRQMGKVVTYNDILPSNHIMAQALFTNAPVEIDEDFLQQLFVAKKDFAYKKTVQDLYQDIYFTDEENQQIDVLIQNVELLSSKNLKNEIYYLLFQALLSKRPYNLFHRANLNMRTNDVKRSFGNKVTWDKPIIEHCLKFLKELRLCRSLGGNTEMNFSNHSAFELNSEFDLVYLDTPYAKSKGTQESNYFNFYHFLDALLVYQNIEKLVKHEVKHKPIYECGKTWYPTENIDEAFCKLFFRFKKSQLVTSYRSDGFPTVERLTEILSQTHCDIQIIDIGDYKYALSTRKVETKEVVIIAQSKLR